MATVRPISVLILLALHLAYLSGFAPNVAPPHGAMRRRSYEIQWRSRPTVFSSSPENGSNLDDLRRVLEAAWNTETMGHVPTSALGASEAAIASLNMALERDDDATSTGLFLIDILLPQYDITAGTNLYDEVLAVEFCIALANLLPTGKTEILVRDDKVLRTVTRVLKAREGSTSAAITTKQPAPKAKAEAPTLAPEFYDDFADFGVKGESLDSSPDGTDPTTDGSSRNDFDAPIPAAADKGDRNDGKDSIESFREMLLLSWDAAVDLDAVPPNELIEENEPVDRPVLDGDNPVVSADKPYRLASFLGDTSISRGSDMMDDVIAAVKANALPNEDEETIIILSPMSKEELYAVRAMVGKYKESKTFILVNCKLDPLPQELLRAQTVYSILPLIARRTGNSNARLAPKVVVLRRFPRDWEVFVDTGSGFDLAATVPATSTGSRRGPSMEWISSAVKRYLQNRVI